MLQIAGLLLANPSNPASTACCLIFHPRFRRSETGLCVSQCPGLARAVTHSDTFIGGGNSRKWPTSEADNYWPLLMWCLTDRYREQARSHKGSAPGKDLCSPKTNCGSELARDEARTTTPTPPANKKPHQITPGRASTHQNSCLSHVHRLVRINQMLHHARIRQGRDIAQAVIFGSRDLAQNAPHDLA